MDDEELANYLDYAGEYIAATGIRTVRVPHAGDDFDDRLGGAYFDALEPLDYLGVYFGTNGSSRGLPHIYPGVGVPSISPAYTLNAFNKNEILSDLAGREPGVIAADVAVDAVGLQGMAVDDSSVVGGIAAEITLPMNGNLALSVGPLNLTPGDYSASFSLRLPDGPAGDLSADIYVGERFRESMWSIITKDPIGAQDFASGDGYQEFRLNFTVLPAHRDIEVRLDYFGNSALRVDEIRIESLSPGQLPVLASVFIGLAGPIDRLDDAMLLGEEFENTGGIVLHPHEFAAILNVEFMSEFVEEVLGGSSVAAADVQLLVDDGRWFEALRSIRAALQVLPMMTLPVDVSGGVIEIVGSVYFEEPKVSASRDVVSVRAHSAPGADRPITIVIPGGIGSGSVSVEVDGVRVDLRRGSGRGVVVVAFVLPAGSHRIELSY